MAKIINTITKQEQDPWIMVGAAFRNDYFTQEEIDTIITPYFAFLDQLAGYNKTDSAAVVDGNQATVTTVFDTAEDAAAALPLLFGDRVATEVAAKNQLLSSKRQSYNVNYTYNVTVEP